MINYTVLRTGIFAILLLGIGCTEPEPSVPPSQSEGCRSEELSKLLWRPEAALSEVSLKNTRVIRPGMAVTMDFRPSRTNVVIGKSGRIERVYCG